MRIHRNLHNARRGGPQWVHTERGRVSEYLDTVSLKCVTTRIQAGGRAKCQVSQVRSVCAFFDGTPAHGYEVPPLIQRGWVPVVFDPRRHEAFTTPEGERWNTAEYAELASDGRAWVFNPTWEE